MSDDPIKDALSMIPYGLFSVTSRNGEDVNAMVANWVMQASFEPRLVAMGLQKTSYTHGVVAVGRVFAINIFSKEDREAIKPFTKGRSRNPDKMTGASYKEAPVTRCPILEGAAAYIELKVVDLFDVGGDHDILVGEAVGAGVLKPTEAADVLTLPYLGWSYAG